MAAAIEIPVGPLTEAAFAPFGQIVSVRDGAPLFAAPGVKTWGVDFEIDGTVEIHFARFDHAGGMAFAKMERHFNVTQAFLPLDGAPSVKVFAAPTDPDPSTIPERKDTRASYLDGGRAA
jgi:ureidoglycolate lyase